MTSVWFMGSANQRLITAADWARAGFSHDDTEWNNLNGWSLPSSLFTAPEISYLATQDDFQVNAADGPRDPGYVPPTPPSPPTSTPRIPSVTELLSYVDQMRAIANSVDGVLRVRILEHNQAVPVGTPANTVILRKSA